MKNLKTATLLVWALVIFLTIFQLIESQAVGSNSIIGLFLFPLILIAIVLTTMSLAAYLKKDSVVAPQAAPTPPVHNRKKSLVLGYLASAVISFFTFIMLNIAPWFLGTVPKADAEKIYNTALLLSFALFIVLCIWVTHKNKPNSPN